MSRARHLARRFREVRGRTTALVEPLDVEDLVAQSMPDASPVKWHLAHTTWFFEEMVLAEHVTGFRRYDPRWGPLFNSYYEALGPRHARPERGLLTRPTVQEVRAYREATDARVLDLLERSDDGGPTGALDRIELGLHHEEQHQELILTDLLHLFSRNPLAPALSRSPPRRAAAAEHRWIEHAGGLVAIGHGGDGFAFDNETPRHEVMLAPFAVSSRLVTNAEMKEFAADGGYDTPSLWLADGWAARVAGGWTGPLHTDLAAGRRFSLHGAHDLDLDAPAAHVSFYEADAFARWAGARLPTEAEWEVTRGAGPIDGQLLGSPPDVLVPVDAGRPYGATWVWTASPYVGYPGYAPAEGAVGEYNGKFMCNQIVLRGGSCFTPPGHVRPTYRNFFPPAARWQVTGLRLARRRG